MKYSDLLAEDMRLVILRALAEDADYSHNEYVLSAICGAMGHHVSRDKLRSELAWLSEQGLIEIDEVEGTTVAKLTRRGKDAATGASRIPGVKRPEPM